MRLQARLALASLAVMVPLVGALVVFDAMTRHRAAERVLTAIVLERLPSERDRCELSPADWGGQVSPGPSHHEGGPGPRRGPPPGSGDRGPPPDFDERRGLPARRGPPPDFDERRGPRGDAPNRARPAEFFAYDEQLRPSSAAAPPLDRSLAARIEGRDAAVDPLAWLSPEVTVLLRTPWNTGPCAFVLARGTTGEWGAVLPDSWFWLLPMVLVYASVLLALAPVVRRIRRLTAAVRRSASADYGEPIALAGQDEIGELARAFEAAGSEIRKQLVVGEKREKALRDFLANTTHDVMIPLTVLQGHLTTLRERAGASSPEAKVASSAMNEAHYLASLVHNLGAVARLDGAEAALQPGRVDLEALVARVVSRHAPVAAERGITIESATPPEPTWATADVTLLEQAVSNVTYNAVRYNRPGGHVAVILETEGGRFSLRVLDDGPGIPEAELSTIVQRGHRGNEARQRAPEGQGLGLHIAFRAAELHGFRLTLGPSEDGGVEARLEGPLA